MSGVGSPAVSAVGEVARSSLLGPASVVLGQRVASKISALYVDPFEGMTVDVLAEVVGGGVCIDQALFQAIHVARLLRTTECAKAQREA